MRGTMRAEMTDRATLRRVGGLAVALAASWLFSACAWGQGGIEEIDRPEGRRVAGRIEGNVRSGFRFARPDAGSPIPLEPGVTIHRGGPGPGGRASTGPPPFHLLAG